MRVAIIIYGTPGSGKGMQANLLARSLNLIHFDTGKYFESIVHDPRHQNDPIIRKRREEFESGKWLYPPWTLKMVKEKVKKIVKADYGIVFSGSPRTLFEAKGLLSFLSRAYGKKNIMQFVLNVSDNTSIRRNSLRLACKVCGNNIIRTLLPKKINLKVCPICGSTLYRRMLDNKKLIKFRLIEHRKRTKPIFSFLKKRGYVLNEINGEGKPEEIFNIIQSKVLHKLESK